MTESKKSSHNIINTAALHLARQQTYSGNAHRTQCGLMCVTGQTVPLTCLQCYESSVICGLWVVTRGHQRSGLSQLIEFNKWGADSVCDTNLIPMEYKLIGVRKPSLKWDAVQCSVSICFQRNITKSIDWEDWQWFIVFTFLLPSAFDQFWQFDFDLIHILVYALVHNLKSRSSNVRCHWFWFDSIPS